MRTRTDVHYTGLLRTKRGVVLTAIYMMVSVITALQTIYLARVLTDFKLAQREENRLKAAHYAEAGLDRAIAELTLDENYAGSVGPLPLGQGSYAITVTPHPTLADTVIADVIGAYPGLVADPAVQQRRIEALIQKDRPFFNLALFGHQSVYIMSDLFLNSYDSRDGPFGGENSGLAADIGTNSVSSNTLTVGNTMYVYTSSTTAYCGPGTAPTGGCAQIYAPAVAYQGEDNLPAAITIPAITPPAAPYPPQDLIVAGSATVLLSPAHPLVFQVPGASPGHYTMVLENLSVTNSAVVNVAPAITRLNIFVQKNVTINGNVSVGDLVEHNTERFLIFATNAQMGSPYMVTLGGWGSFVGAVYSPNLRVRIISGIHLMGAIAASSVYAYGGLVMAFDRRLLDLYTGPGPNPRVVTWRND